jgi:hypothetical protein
MESLRSKGRYKIGVLCKALGLSRSGYHAWKRRKPSLLKLEEDRIVAAIKSAHERGRGNYGPEKILTKILAIDGLDVSLNRIKRLRRKHGIRCKQKRKFKATTDSKHKMPVAPNLLKPEDHNRLHPLRGGSDDQGSEEPFGPGYLRYACSGDLPLCHLIPPSACCRFSACF